MLRRIMVCNRNGYLLHNFREPRKAAESSGGITDSEQNQWLAMDYVPYRVLNRI